MKASTRIVIVKAANLLSAVGIWICFIFRSSGAEATTTNVNTGRGERQLLATTNGVTAAVRERTVFKPREKPGLFDLSQGALRVFARQKQSSEVRTPFANAASINTEFEVAIEGGRTIVTVFEGLLILTAPGDTNQFLEIHGGETGVAQIQGDRVNLSKAATVTGFGLMSTNRVQWWLYFPAILDLNELHFSATDQAALSSSIAAWKAGNLRRAWLEFPQDKNDANWSDERRIFYAALRLTAGETADAYAILAKLGPDNPPANGLRELISAVQHQSYTNSALGDSPTAWLARSYWLQAQTNIVNPLKQARAAVQKAVDLDRANGFALARLAEIDFSSGAITPANKALTEALADAPEFAAAHAMLGFIHAAQNHFSKAEEDFERAIRFDSLLPEGWLGRGLLAFHHGRRQEGLNDLQLAAILAGDRALIRTYLGKAFAEVYDEPHARIELDMARKADPNDPTPLLYSALDHYSNYRVNEAVSDLEESIRLNDNRAIYRSDLLLYEDRAVRGASLARIYQRAGLNEVALREATRAVTSDYANPAAHLFEADSFNALRDPTRFNLRYETAWFNEWLLANALSPVDAGVLSPNLTYQEYTRLFASDGLFLTSFGEARSDGQYRQLATQGGSFGRSAYAIDLDWQHNDGVRPNNFLDRTEVYVQIKQQVTDHDTALVITKFESYDSGDNFQDINPDLTFSPNFRFQEDQEPIAVGIWRHDWAPGVQTLALAGRLENHQIFGDVFTGSRGFPIYSRTMRGRFPATLTYESSFESYVGELNQIVRNNRNTFVGGGRAQGGTFTTSDLFIGSPSLARFFGDTTGQGIFHNVTVAAPFARQTAYAYDTYEIVDGLYLTGGVAIDSLEQPRNFRNPPVAEGHDSKTRALPKSAIVWDAADGLTFRGMYAQSLGGVSFDESFRLEPVQLAGFSQAYRTVIPESLIGSVSGHELELWGGAVDIKLPSHTYLGAQGSLTRSAVDQSRGYFYLASFNSGQALQAAEALRYEETALQFTADQLLGRNWSIGAHYQFSLADFSKEGFASRAPLFERARLHTLQLQAIFNSQPGWFGRTVSTWWWQTDNQFQGTSRHDQLDIEAGWRFPKQRGEISVGVMDLLNGDYHLSPLSGLSELPRERVFFTRLRLNLK